MSDASYLEEVVYFLQSWEVWEKSCWNILSIHDKNTQCFENYREKSTDQV